MSDGQSGLTEQQVWEWLDRPVPPCPNIQARELPAVQSAFEQGFIAAQQSVMRNLLFPLVEARTK